MKKILFLLLMSVYSYGQADFPEGIQISGGQPTVTSVNFLTTTDNTISGLQGKIAPVNLPIPYSPSNYSTPTQTIGSHLAGIDTRLGQISSTSAGVTQRVWFTADNTIVNAVTYFASNLTGKGATATGSPPALVLGDNTKAYFTKDVISIAQPSVTIGYAGTYSGNLTVYASPTPVATQQRFTLEIYRTNNLGVPIASGVSGAPTGDLGVTVIAILDSGIINLVAGAITNIPVTGVLTQNIIINTGERLRYHVSAAKIGTGGGSVTFGVYYGTSYNSYYDIPVAITTDAVLNKSNVSPAITNTDALNVLNSKITNASASKGLLIGDSTIAAYLGTNGIDYYLLENSDIQLGSTILNQAVPGHTINQQLAVYNADANKATYDWIIVQVGLNDMVTFGESATTVIARYQNLINTIFSTKKASAKIIVSAMLPCKQRWIDLLGTTDGAAAQAKWEAVNEAIMGGGANPVVNVDFRNNQHVEPLSDGTGNLSVAYNPSNDHIHENNQGRQIIASAFRSILFKGGLFKIKSENSFSKYLMNNGKYTYLKDGIFNIDSYLALGDYSLYIRNKSNGTNQYTQTTYAITKTDNSETQLFSTGVGNYSNGTTLEEKFYLFYNNPAVTSYPLWYTDKNGNFTNRGTFTSNGNIFAPDVEITSNTNDFSTALNLKNNNVGANARVGINMTNASGQATVFYRSASSGTVLFSNAGDWVIDIAGATNGRSKFYASGNVSFGNETDNGIARVQVVGNASGTLAASNSSHFMRKGEHDSDLALKANANNAVLTGNPTAPNQAVGDNDTSIANTAFVVANSRPYKLWVGKVLQSATSAPTAPQIAENTLGGTIVWSYSAVGTYIGTLTGAFDLNKTYFYVTQSSAVSNARFVSLKAGSANTIELVTIDTTGAKADNLADLYLEIRTYP